MSMRKGNDATSMHARNGDTTTVTADCAPSGILSTLATQWRVICALMLREIHTVNGSDKLGYLWRIFQTSFNIAIFWAIRAFTRAQAPHGMTILSFLALGFIIFHVFSRCLTTCMHAIQGNRNLLTYPQVYPLDIMVARCLVISATEVVSGALILGVGVIAGYPEHVTNVGMLVLALLLAMTFGLGCGIIFAALAWYVPVVENLVNMVLLRALFFASGVFFSVTVFSHKVGSWLLLNPVMQIIEMARSAMSVGYVSPYVDTTYVLFVNLSVVTAGLLLQGFMQRRLQA